MKIFEVPLGNNTEKIYLYCKLNDQKELNENVDLFPTYIDCKENKNKITKETHSYRYSKIIEALKEYSKKILY